MDGNESCYRAWLDERKNSGLLRELNQAGVDEPGCVTYGGEPYVNFSGNDYLGLSRRRELISRASEWTQQYGTGAGASRLVTGNLELFEGIERKVASLKGFASALVMASGFQTNAAVLQAVLDKKVLGAEPLVFCDRLNHASMHFGCQAAGIHQHRYRHCDMKHLVTLLEKFERATQPKFILTESVFSMDGDVAPMEEIAKLASAHGATLICDDAHATGVLGEGGKGLSEGSDIVIGTFSKALGSYGAYVACSKNIKDYLVNHCSGLIYSTALPPPVLGAIDASLDLLPALDAERVHVAGLAERFRNGVRALGFDTGASATQIVPVIIGETGAALDLSERLARAGYWAAAIRPPTVPDGTARLRFAFSAVHTSRQVDELLEVLADMAAGRRVNMA